MVADSRDVAATFGKLHANVLVDIRRLVASEPKLAELNFQFSEYVDPTARSSLLTRQHSLKKHFHCGDIRGPLDLANKLRKSIGCPRALRALRALRVFEK
jgi:Phage regulatory protein Rha (Phage_pRha)